MAYSIDAKHPGPGRPIIPLDWDAISTMVQEGASRAQVADYYGVSVETLERHSQENGVDFAAWHRHKIAVGRQARLKRLHNVAMGEAESTMPQMTGLIWAQKNLDGWTDGKHEVHHTVDLIQQVRVIPLQQPPSNNLDSPGETPQLTEGEYRVLDNEANLT